MRAGSSGAALPYVVLLLALVGAGGWNYHRNWQLDESRPRPFRGHSAAEVEALISAYESEAAQLEQAARAQTTAPVRDAGFGEAHQEYERVRRAGSERRALGNELAGREARLRELREEQELRAAEADVLRLHLRRLTRF